MYRLNKITHKQKLLDERIVVSYSVHRLDLLKRIVENITKRHKTNTVEMAICNTYRMRNNEK